MISFHHAVAKRRAMRAPEGEARLSPGTSILVIGGLSAVSWMSFILLALAVWSIL